MSLRTEKAEKIRKGLYCITAQNLSKGRDNITVVREMLMGGAKIIQYREKYREIKARYEECLEIKRLCQEYGAIFIINDNIDIALLVKPDGVHIGQDDLPIDMVRKLVGEDMLIGLSTHSPQQAQRAVEMGADYIGVGPIYPTKTKDNVCEAVGLEYLSYVAENINIPYVAIGGIKEHNMEQVVQAGGKCLCMVSDIIGADNISEKVRKIINILDKQ